MNRMLSVIAAAALLITLVVPAVQAGTHPHDRNGFLIGLGVGAGSLGFEDDDERETSVTGNFRIGYAVRPDLAIHLESSAWTKTYENAIPALGIGDVTLTSSTVVAALTYFPEGQGAYLRGGIGGGIAEIEVESGGVTISDNDSGFAFLAGAGYQWRLTKKFALGPSGQFAYHSLDILGTSTIFGGSLDLDWFW